MYVLGSDEWMCQVCESIGVDPSLVTRIVIDARASEPVICHVFFLAGKEVATADLPPVVTVQAHKEADKVFLEL